MSTRRRGRGPKTLMPAESMPPSTIATTARQKLSNRTAFVSNSDVNSRAIWQPNWLLLLWLRVSSFPIDPGYKPGDTHRTALKRE